MEDIKIRKIGCCFIIDQGDKQVEGLDWDEIKETLNFKEKIWRK